MFEKRAPVAKFTQVGQRVEGDIVDVQHTQQTDWKTRLPYFWENRLRVHNPRNLATGQPNDPVMQYIITIDTGKPTDDSGSTELRLFIDRPRMKTALREAVELTGGRDGLLIGGHLAMAWTGTTPSQGGGRDANTYQCWYRPPADGTGRKPDLTPQLATLAAGPASTPVTPPAPAFPLRQQTATPGRPIVTPYAPAAAGPTQLEVPAPAHPGWSDEPPF